MSTTTKIAAVALAALTLGSAVIVGAGSAEAKNWNHHHHGWGWGGAGIAAGLIGAGIAANAYEPDVVYVGAPRCRWVRQFDVNGYYVGKTKVCRY